MKKTLNNILKNPLTWPVLIVTFFTFFSRFLGFVRQYLVIRNLNELQSDLLINANKIPEIISVVLLMGTIYSSVLPVAARIESKDRDEKNISAYLNLITIGLVGLITVFIILGIIFTPFLLQYFSPGLWEKATNANLISDYILASRILFLFPLAFAMQAIWGVFLTLKKRFLVYSLAGVITNLGTVAALLITQGDFVKVAFGIVWGGFLASILFLYYSLLDGFKLPKLSFSWYTKQFNFFKKEFWQTWKLFLPRILVIDGFYAASILISVVISADQSTNGGITAFDIGTSIQGAFFIIVTSLGTVLFPDLSKTFHDKNINRVDFWKKTSNYIKISAVLGLAVTVITMIGSPLIVLLFKFLGQQQNNGNQIILIAQVTSISLVFRAVREVLVRYIYIRERVWQPLILSTASGIVLIITTLILINQFNFEAVLAVSVGFISYNFFWVLLAWIIYKRDYYTEKPWLVNRQLVLFEEQTNPITTFENIGNAK